MDPIHGLVQLTSEEVQLQNHGLFQRLRGIKQNGLLHHVFPAATHTRFEHSIGVVASVQGMLEAVYRNSLVAGQRSRVIHPENEERGKAIDLSEVDPESLELMFRVARLAAMAHDLGHGPLSHAFDKFAPPIGLLDSLTKEKSLESIHPMIGVMKAYSIKHWGEGRPNPRVAHECMSCVFLAKILSDNGVQPSVIVSACAVILGAIAFPFDDGRLKNWLPFLHDLIASAPADADRMDYLERDSRSCGVTYGLFDRSRILKALLCYVDSDGRYRLGLKQSGYRAIENFIQARFQLFVQVYFHKTNRAIEQMLAEAARICSAANCELFSDGGTFGDAMSCYLELDDERFLRLFRGEEPLRFAPPPEAAQLALSIRDRKLWRRVFDFQGASHFRNIDPECLREQLSVFAEGKPIEIDRPKIKPVKDLEKGAVPLIRDALGHYSVQAAEWSEVSPIIKALEREEEELARLFVRASDPDLVETLRRKAIELARTTDVKRRQ